MKFLDTARRSRNLPNARKYLIDWEAKSLSKFQKKVKDFLHPYWKHDMVFEEFRIVGSRLSLDFYNANKKVAVEVQGGQHLKFIKHFHQNRTKYLDQIKRDQKKFDFCEVNGIKLIEIYPDDEINKSTFSKQGLEL